MNIHIFNEKYLEFKRQSESIKVLIIYRLISLIITSIFFLFDSAAQSIASKVFIISCISFAAIILNYLYIKNISSETKIKILVLIETIGNTLILIPSGGVNSPYVWYSLNTLLIASIYLGKRYVWLNLFIYLFGSTGAFVTFFQQNSFNLAYLVNSKDLILSLVLITCAVQLLARYVNKIKIKNEKLIDVNHQLLQANKKIKDSLSYIVELYEAVEIFSTVKNRSSLIDQVLNCTQKITKSDMILFYDLSGDNQLIIKSNSILLNAKENTESKILENREKVLSSPVPVEILINNNTYILVSVKSNYMTYGILGFQISFYKNIIDYSESIDQLKFLSKLCSITLEKFEYELVNDRLLITQEQNRIASEIHDSALQRLFSISCGIYSLIQNPKKLNKKQVTGELNLIGDSINNTMKELRTAIYGLSWAKGGQNNFEIDINNYLSEMRRLNNVEIKLNILGNHDLLSCLQRKAFYRVICEGISNAVHHGKAAYIKVTLYIKPEKILLYIVDNGTGFDTKTIKSNNDRGLGLTNIHNLIYSLNGNINLTSAIGKGTRLEISIPAKDHLVKEDIV